MNIPAHVPANLVYGGEGYLNEYLGQADPMAALHEARKKFPELYYTSATGRGDSQEGRWVVTTDALIREILQDAENFSSKGISGFGRLLGEDLSLVPLEIDPPLHADFRRAMAPYLSPKRLATEIEPEIRKKAIELIDDFKEKGQCEFTKEFGTPLPIIIFMRLVGLPLERYDEFLALEGALLRGKTLEEQVTAAKAIKEVLVGMIADRRKEPTDDILSDIVNMTVGERKISDKEALGAAFLFFVGGLDTVAATLGYVFKFLADNPDKRQQLIEEPTLIPAATEELLRRFTVVPTRRVVARDMEFHGVTMKKGDIVECDLSLANTDPAVYENPLEVDFERMPAHIAFVVGPHRCMGSHLGRLEIQIAIEEWLARIPQFSVKPGAEVVSHYPSVKGLASLPLVW